MNIKRNLARLVTAALAVSLLSVSPAQAVAPSPGPKAVPATSAKGTVLKGVKAPKGMPARKGDVSTRIITPCAGGACYDYSGGGQDLADPGTGLHASLTISNAYLARSTNNTMGQNDPHTVMEVAARNPATTAGQENIAEIGWNVNPNSCGGSSTACLFVYHWIDGVGQGYGTNFTDLSGQPGYSPIGPGDSLSAHVGQTRQFGMTYLTNAQSTNREGWWAYFNSLYVGYYPIANWTGAGETFTETDRVEAFAEVLSGNVETCSDMGSGAMAGTAPSSNINSYNVFGTTDTVDLNGLVTTPANPHYGRTTVGTPVTTVRVGGYGYDSDGDGAGSVGSCAPATLGTPPASTMQVWEQVCPDSPAATGCDAGASWTAGSTTLNVCFAVPAGFEAQVLRNNSGVGGRNYQFYRSAGGGCTGATVGAGNASTVLLDDTWDFNAITSGKRTG
jgi:hypothetical protein